MSTYVASEAALLTAVRATNGGALFTAQNSARGDFTVLDRSGVTAAAVLWQAGKSDYGDELDDYGAHGTTQERHRIADILFQSRGQANDGVSAAALHTNADALIAHLHSVPTLSGAVLRAEVVEADVPRVRQGSAWIFQSILVEVRTETDETEVPEI